MPRTPIIWSQDKKILKQVKINKDYLFLFKFWEDPKTYVNESANQQSGLVVYITTTNFQNETKYIAFPIFS